MSIYFDMNYEIFKSTWVLAGTNKKSRIFLKIFALVSEETMHKIDFKVVY